MRVLWFFLPSFWEVWLFCRLFTVGALIYTDFGTPERREKYKQQQEDYERVSRERRLARRRNKALEEQKKE